MMRIALIGYGKMGKTVEKAAKEQGHEIVHIMDIGENPMEKGFSGEWTKRTEVLIDFSLGPVVPANVGNAVRAGVPIVVGATGWYDRLEEVRQTVVEGGGA